MEHVIALIFVGTLLFIFRDAFELEDEGGDAGDSGERGELVILDEEDCRGIECVECGKHPVPGEVIYMSSVKSSLYLCCDQCKNALAKHLEN